MYAIHALLVSAGSCIYKQVNISTATGKTKIPSLLTQNTRLQMIKVALADDHHQVREIWDFILSANGSFSVVAKCRNGDEAIAAAGTCSPDVFLMDINMQPLNGIDATGIITKTFPAIKVIGMSMHHDTVYVKKMLEAGASGYVTKNSSYEEVVKAILQVNAGHCYLCKEVQAKSAGLLEPLQ